MESLWCIKSRKLSLIIENVPARRRPRQTFLWKQKRLSTAASLCRSKRLFPLFLKLQTASKHSQKKDCVIQKSCQSVLPILKRFWSFKSVTLYSFDKLTFPRRPAMLSCATHRQSTDTRAALPREHHFPANHLNTKGVKPIILRHKGFCCFHQS